MSTGLKVWLWIVFILNVVGIGCWVMAATVTMPILAGLDMALTMVTGVMGLVNTLFSVVATVGVALILFGRKKVGLYLMIAAAALGFILNIIGGYNIFVALIGQGIVPAITFWIMAAEWHVFE